MCWCSVTQDSALRADIRKARLLPLQLPAVIDKQDTQDESVRPNEQSSGDPIRVPRGIDENEKFVNYVSMTRACCQTYFESRSMLYACNTFLLPALDTGYDWLPTRPVEQRTAMTSIIVPLTLMLNWEFSQDE